MQRATGWNAEPRWPFAWNRRHLLAIGRVAAALAVAGVLPRAEGAAEPPAEGAPATDMQQLCLGPATSLDERVKEAPRSMAGFSLFLCARSASWRTTARQRVPHLGLCAVNLIPAFPLDVGNLVYLVIDKRWGPRVAALIGERTRSCIRLRQLIRVYRQHAGRRPDLGAAVICHQLARIPIGASWQRRLEQERY